VLTFLIDSSDVALGREPFSQAVMYWRSNLASRKPKCIACRASFADGVAVGGWLFATPEGAQATSVSAFCVACWSDLDDAELEAVALRVLQAVKPGARFAS